MPRNVDLGYIKHSFSGLLFHYFSEPPVLLKLLLALQDTGLQTMTKKA